MGEIKTNADKEREHLRTLNEQHLESIQLSCLMVQNQIWSENQCLPTMAKMINDTVTIAGHLPAGKCVIVSDSHQTLFHWIESE